MGPELKYRIMVVDDDPDVRLVIEEVLRPKYEVVLAHDGADALDKLVKYEPDFVIMDIVMPHMDGFEACAAIRKKPSFQSTQVLFLSAFGSRENIARGYEIGANLFIPKPVEPSRLLKNVDLFFQQARPPVRTKRMTYHQIQMIEGTEKKGAGPSRPSASGGAPPTPPRGVPYPMPQNSAPAADRSPERLPSEQPAQPALPTDEGQMPRVLVVEDDPDLAEMVALTLGGCFEVVIARDGIEGAEKTARCQPDLLVVDVMLPKMNGYQLCQSVRANRLYAHTPIVIITAKKTSRDREYASKVGANAFLAKPFEMDELLNQCVELTKTPEFSIRPKSASLAQLNAQDTAKIPRPFLKGNFQNKP